MKRWGADEYLDFCATECGLVQQHYVNARVNEINKQYGDRYKADTIQAFRTDPTLAARIKGYTSAKKLAFCEDAYRRLTMDLQSRDLTINLKSASWFTTENPYDSYAQMYERGARTAGWSSTTVIL